MGQDSVFTFKVFVEEKAYKQYGVVASDWDEAQNKLLDLIRQTKFHGFSRNNKLIYVK